MIVHQTQLLNMTPKGGLDYSSIFLEDSASYPPYEFEIFDWKAWYAFAYQNQHYPLYAGLIYIPLIFGLQHFMKNRQPFDLKWESFFWNAAIGMISIFGIVRMAPEFLETILQPGGLYASICIFKPPSMSRLFWSLIFTLTKYVELGDTVFIVLKKKPLELTQWYHHIITLTVAWITMPYIEPFAIYCGSMNVAVHSLLYPYFALKALDYKIPRWVAKTITTLQLGQMLMGLFVNVYSAYSYYYGPPCYRYPDSIKLFVVVYASFIILFGRLFVRLVLTRNAKKIKKE